MLLSDHDKQVLYRLGGLLSYPSDDLPDRIAHLIDVPYIFDFKAAISTTPLTTLAELYTRTFDVMPVCIPYVSVHLFGEESFHRARLMAGMRGTLHHAGCTSEGELPDHIAVILKAAPKMKPEELADLVEYALRGAVHAMTVALEGTTNPYELVLKAVQSVVGAATERDIERLDATRKAIKSAGEERAKAPPTNQPGCGVL